MAVEGVVGGVESGRKKGGMEELSLYARVKARESKFMQMYQEVW